MNMQKGIVFETTNAYSIFLTSDGLFEKGIPLNSSVQIGEEVYFRPYQNIKQRKMKDSYRSQWMTPLLSVVATIVFLFSVLLPAQSSVSAYVQIDINPSIELGINNAGNVYSFKGMNDDGLAIKRDISFWKGKPLSWVLLQIVDRTESLIIEKEMIEITTIYQNDKGHDKLEKVIETAVATSTNQILPKKSIIKVNEATVSDWKSATNKGVSVQKYQKELKEKSEAKREKVKIKEKAKEVQTDVQKTETKKDGSNSKVKDKGTKEKKEPKKVKPTPQKKPMTNEKQSNKDVQEKQQNNGKKQKSKENQKVNDQTYKNEQPKEKNNMKQQNKQKSKSADTKDTKSNFSNNSSDIKGNEKKNKNVKVSKKLKTNENKHREQGNIKEIKHESKNKKH